MKQIDCNDLCIGFQSPKLDELSIENIVKPKDSNINQVCQHACSYMDGLVSSIKAEIFN